MYVCSLRKIFQLIFVCSNINCFYLWKESALSWQTTDIFLFHKRLFELFNSFVLTRCWLAQKLSQRKMSAENSHWYINSFQQYEIQTIKSWIFCIKSWVREIILLIPIYVSSIFGMNCSSNCFLPPCHLEGERRGEKKKKKRELKRKKIFFFISKKDFSFISDYTHNQSV